jgi:hypothetical protein
MALASRNSFWIALDIPFRKLAGNRLGLHWEFTSASWLAVALDALRIYVNMLANRFGLHCHVVGMWSYATVRLRLRVTALQLLGVTKAP